MSETTPFEALAPSCQEAVRQLRERRPEAEVVAVHANWAYVSVGHIEVGRIVDVFEQDEALGIVRIPKNFPGTERPYGIVTVPYLERSDGREARKQHRSHNHARPVEEALGVEDTGFWSWRWDGVSHDDPGDLKKAPDLIRERLRREGG